MHGQHSSCGGKYSSAEQLAGGWVVGVGDGVSTRGVRLLIGKEVLLLLTSFHDFVEILWGTRITSAHCQLRRKSMIAVLKLDPKGGQTCGAAGISWLVCPKSFFGFFCRLGASPRNLVIATFKPPAWPNHKHNNSILQCLMKTLSNLHCPHSKKIFSLLLVAPAC